MSGSKKNLTNIEGQLKEIQKRHNNKIDSVGREIAVLDCAEFKARHDHTSAMICKSKAKQHKSSRKHNMGVGQKIIGHTDYSERSF